MEQQTLIEATEVQKQLLRKTIAMLNATGVKYALVDFDGNKHGSLEIATEPAGRKRTRSLTPYGSLLEYAMPFVKDMVPGDVVVIPATELFTPPRLQSTVSGWTSRVWGDGCATTHQNHTTNTLEVLRIA
jgi:hypothetical protein